jgi:uncharacterized membrane protein
MQTFFLKNKVFLIGLAGAITVVLQQFVGQLTVDWKVVGYAVGMAVLSYISNQWRGQGVTILGIFGTLAGTFYAISSTGTFTWGQFIVSSMFAMLAAVAPPPKPLSYEQNATIVAAKTEPPVAEVKDNTVLPVGIKP